MSADYGHFSPAEKKFIRENKVASLRIRELKRLAECVAWERYQKAPHELHNGRGDAFRHAYWSALMTVHCGEDVARKVGFAHEAVPPRTQPRSERDMDEHNNAAGRRIGVTNRLASDTQLADEVQRAMESGLLKWL